MSLREREDIKEQVALACRMLEAAGLIDFSGHISARDPEEGIWIHPIDKPRNQVAVEDLVRLSLDGSVLEGTARKPSETPIHTEIYRRRPDVGSVAHLHPPITTALSIAGVAFLPVIQHGALFADGVPVLDDSRHVNTPERGARLAEVLGAHRAAIIRGHGAVVVGKTVVDCFMACVYLEDNARQLWRALAVGQPRPITPEEASDGVRSYGATSAQKVWDYYRIRLGL